MDTVAFRMIAKKKRKAGNKKKERPSRKASVILENLQFSTRKISVDTYTVFLAKAPGVYQFKIKNRSFLTNEFYLSVQKLKRDSILKDVPVFFDIPPVSFMVDTLRHEQDTVLYIPCQLNLKKRSRDTLIFTMNNIPVEATIVRRGQYPSVLQASGMSVLLSEEGDCLLPLDKKQGQYEFFIDAASLQVNPVMTDTVLVDAWIMAHYPKLDSLFLATFQNSKKIEESKKNRKSGQIGLDWLRRRSQDSLDIKRIRMFMVQDIENNYARELNTFVGKQKQSMQTLLPLGCRYHLDSENITLALENTDRVVGKYYHVRVLETIITIKPKEDKK
jgi:hypothetical protein